MPENEIEKSQEASDATPVKRRKRLSARNLGLVGVVIAAAFLLTLLVGIVAYWFGFFDGYVKDQFTAKMADIGVVFTADKFVLTASPFELNIENATFNDRLTGEKLFFIRKAHLGLSVPEILAWQLSRDVRIDTTDIEGAEVWIKFDENGKSNFSNLVFVEDQAGGAVNFRYDTIKFSLRDGKVHVGDITRKISGDANNVLIKFEPETAEVLGFDPKRYKIDLTSTASRFVYDERPLEPIDIRAKAIAHGEGAEITELHIETPIGVADLSGTVTDWAALKYDLNIESNVDLTQASNTFPLGATLRGVGNFKGRVTGEGETYRVEGTADSQALAADGIYLKGINIEGTVAGTNANYEANGKAVGELLTFEDFRIEFPRMTGNVRGTGTDFRWVGELQAAAFKSGSLTLGSLFLRDAVAELKDKEFALSAGTARAKIFEVGSTDFDNLTARNLKLTTRDGELSITASNAESGSFKLKNNSWNGLSGSNLRVKNRNKQTTVDIDNLNAKNSNLGDVKLGGLRAKSFNLTDKPATTDITLKGVTSETAQIDGTRIAGIESPEITITDGSVDTKIYADKLRVARVTSGSAVLGTLNIAGVRMTIREGRIEATSNDIDAGSIAITKNASLPEGGAVNDVKIVKPVFIVEPSGRYRASADMSIGGGIIGSIPLGNATAKVNVNNDRVELNELNASVMEGSLSGKATFAFNSRAQSKIAADFTNLDLGKVIALQTSRVVPIDGQTTGRADLTFNGTDLSTATGTLKADIAANAGSADKGQVPITGVIDVVATNGLFNIDLAKLNTEKSEFNATGRFDMRADDSNLQVALRSTDASEIDRLFRVLGISSDAVTQLDSMEAQFAGDLAFNGNVTGNISDPVIDGKASVYSVVLHGRDIGSVETAINVSPVGVNLRDGKLTQRDGGNATFAVTVPYGLTNSATVTATLNGINAGNLIAALPFALPERLRDFNGKTSGTVALSGLPNNSQGSIDLTAANGTIAGQTFDSLKARADFQGTTINITSGEIRVGDGLLSVNGNYDRANNAFDLNLTSKSIPLPLVLSFLPQSSAIPSFSGLVDLTAKATGEYGRATSYNINFDGTARDVVINENAFGVVTFKGTTVNQTLNAELVANLEGRPQPITATLNFGSADLPLRVETTLSQSPLGPFFALVPQLRGIQIAGTGTGTVEFGGNLYQIDPNGVKVFSSTGLSGSAQFSSLALRIQETPIDATEAVRINFSSSEIEFEAAKFAGSGSNLTIAGTKALSADGRNDLSIIGRVNLALLNVFRPVQSSDTFFGGLADVEVRLTGPNSDSRLQGSATAENASIATFIGTDRFTFDRLNGRVLFNSNQAQIERMTGYLGGGQFTATGGLLFADDLSVNSYRVSLNGNNITVPYPKDFITTGDAAIDVSGSRVAGELTMLVSGNINARRSLYSKDIDLATVVGGRREGSLSTGGASSISAPRFDLVIEGRNALIVQNNVADLTASVTLRIGGTSEDPQISGRIVANGGQVFFRRDRYDVQRLVLEFPPDTSIEPRVNLQAESQIAGYQIYVNLNGSLTDTELLNASVRSSPALPQADVISLITTGSLSNTESGIPTLAQTGLNTAAEALTDSIINDPIRKATDRLFGLNVFEIDPIISGDRINPTARLTVGRQINNNLRVTYSTNLSQDQNQVVAVEYRISNNFSFIAQYEQRSLSNVTSRRDNFSFGVRLRRRF